MKANIQELTERWQALKADRATWDSLHQELGDMCCPRKAQIITHVRQPNTDKERRIYNSTAQECAMVNAHGQMTYAMPFSERWFATEPPADMQNDVSFRWYGKVGEIMAQKMAISNLYTEIHEACIDRVSFGAGSIYVQEDIGDISGMLFDAVSVGTYSIAEAANKRVDTVYRDKEMTAVQLMQEFGPNLPEAVTKSYNSASERSTKKFKVVHAVYPRSDRDSLMADSLNLPFASCWFMPEQEHLLREGGYEDQPYLVSRYLKWGNEVYGWCPGWQALGPARQLNLLEKIMDRHAEVQLMPRMLIPSTLEGEVGLEAAAATIYNPFMQAKPEEWLTGGKIEAGLERLQRREDEIKKAYHYDLFRMFADLDKQMTAQEVIQRASEKLILFTPTFVRMQQEWLTPLLQRVFKIGMRQRWFPPPPPAIWAVDPKGPHIRPPAIMFNSRIALALRQLQSSGFMHMLEALQPLLAIDPSVRHVVKVGEAAAGLSRNFGVPQEWIATTDDFNAAVQAEQAQQQAQMQAEAANQALQTAGKLKPEQIQAVGKAMPGMRPAA